MVSITDTGIGITEENIKKILSDTDFYTSIGTNDEKGTGLGMKLVKNFLKDINGTLTIESKPNTGSCFSFTLPLA